MTEQERINSEVQMKLAVQDEKFNTVMARIDALVGEMRDRDNQRAAEVHELRIKHDELNTKIDEKFEKILSQLQNMAIATVVGVGAIVWAVVSAFK